MRRGGPENYGIENMTQRLHIMKFIFMIQVVFIHSYALPGLPYTLEVPWYVAGCKDIIVNGICGTAVSGFFFISGILLFSREFTWVDNLKRKGKSLLIPYLLINTFWIIFFKVMQSFEMTAHYFADETYQIKGWKGVVSAYLESIPLYYPFWFLRDLMILNFFAVVIKKAIGRFPVLSALAVILLQMRIIVLPLLSSNSSFCMFALGCYFVKYVPDITKLDKVSIWRTGLLFAGLVVAKLYFLEGHPIFSLLYCACGICFHYQIAGKICPSKTGERILWCSQFTFFIYAFHEFYEAMVKKVLMLLIPQYGAIQLLEFLVLPIGIVMACIAAGTVLKKTFPVLYGLICGQR